MSAHTIPALKALGLTMALIFGALAHAADPVTEAMQAANGPYRMALFKTNGKSQPEALQALTQAQQAWDKLSTQFGGKPAAPYDRYPELPGQAPHHPSPCQPDAKPRVHGLGGCSEPVGQRA